MAVKAVYRCSWVEAAIVFFIPSILLILLYGYVSFGLTRMASIYEIMQETQPLKP